MLTPKADGDETPRTGGAPADAPAPSLARAAAQRRRRRDAALALPLGGLFLLASPLLDVVIRAGSLFGVPVSVLYVFAVWAGLIALTFVATRGFYGPGDEG